MCTKYTYIYMLGGGMKSGLSVFIFRYIFSSRRKRKKNVNTQNPAIFEQIKSSLRKLTTLWNDKSNHHRGGHVEVPIGEIGEIENKKTCCWRWGWVFFENTQILIRFQFTRHFIESNVVETKQFVGSNVNVFLIRQTCDKCSSVATGSKCRALAFYVYIRICYIFLISKCKGESDLGLCTILILANRMPAARWRISKTAKHNL